jgi:hypothetical protein
MRLHDLMFNMQIESKQDLKCKLKGARISLHTQPHDNSFRVYSMFHIEFISRETREIQELNSTDTETNLSKLCSKGSGTTVCSKAYDSRNCKWDIWASYKTSKINYKWFWRWYIAGFLGFWAPLYMSNIPNRTQCFWKWICFRPHVKRWGRTCLLGSGRKR